MGQNFAFMQVKTILSILFREYNIELVSNKLPDIDYEAMVIGPKGDCRVRYKIRAFKFEAALYSIVLSDVQKIIFIFQTSAYIQIRFLGANHRKLTFPVFIPKLEIFVSFMTHIYSTLFTIE